MSGHPNQTSLAALTRARLAWGAAMPDWVEHLALAADRTSQSAAARRIQYSPAVVSHVLKRTYPGALDKVEAAVRAALMRETVACPVLGEISGADCLAQQREPYSNQNPQRVALFSACQRCPNKITGRNR
ncbi:MAG TPA: transcriptional regulator [Stellaceae bacterium]|jgi:hypothetical protein